MFFLFLLLFSAPAQAQAQACDGETEMTVRGSSMEPLLTPGMTVRVRPLACGEPNLGDLAVFSTGAHKAAPVIKQIRGKAGQTLGLSEKGEVQIDGKTIQTVDGKPYIVQDRRARMIRFYQGPIPADTYFLVGRAGSLDSSQVGVVYRRDLSGIVSLKGLTQN